ncbi:MAG: hypothetical protein GY751_26885 [Bacteroidetes bacterium]|nr:hypothetical protein [Bacteroidota bacterium]
MIIRIHVYLEDLSQENGKSQSDIRNISVFYSLWIIWLETYCGLNSNIHNANTKSKVAAIEGMNYNVNISMN